MNILSKMADSNKKGGKINALAFIGQVREELKRVSWPSRREVVRLSGVVIISSVIVGVYIGGIDYLFTNLISLVIK